MAPIEDREWSPIYKEALVIDGLVASPPSGTFAQELIRSGINTCNWTACSDGDDTQQAINKIIPFYWLIEQYPQIVLLVERVSDIEKAKAEGKLGIVLGIQGATPLGRNVHLIRIFRRLGIRIIQITYNESNAFASGCMEPSNRGLTSLGVQAVQEMNRMGVLIDLSHVGERSSLEAIEISTDPVIFSHSNARTIQENPRNLTDEQITSCAAKGGIIGLSTFSAFVGSTKGGRQPSLDEYFKHLNYLLDLVGPDHIGIGTDIFNDPTDGVWWRGVTGRLWPDLSQGMTYETHNIEGFMHHCDFPDVVNVMIDRGYEEGVLRKIIGSNWKRVFSQVWDKVL